MSRHKQISFICIHTFILENQHPNKLFFTITKLINEFLLIFNKKIYMTIHIKIKTNETLNVTRIKTNETLCE